jgi:hypothetical protein
VVLLLNHEIVYAALGYLYSNISLNLIRSDNSRAVLAAGCLLGGMDELCRHAYGVCRQSMSVETIGGWLEFVDTIPPQRDGTVTPELPSTSIFGQYAQTLRDDVFHFLVVTLPEVLEVQRPHQDSSSGPSGRDVLLRIYSRVPFEMFKSAVESPTFLIGQLYFLTSSISKNLIQCNLLQDLIRHDLNLRKMQLNCGSEASHGGSELKRQWY